MNPEEYIQYLAVIAFSVLILFLMMLAFFVLRLIWKNPDCIRGIICEPESGPAGGKASLSRFQALIFTVIIAGLYLILCIETGMFLDVPEGTRWLLTISLGGYVVSKVAGQVSKPTVDGPASTPPTKPETGEKGVG